MSERANLGQEIALAMLRISLGFLLIWWGLAKIFKPGMGVNISNKFYFGWFSDAQLQYAFGYLEIAIGVLVAIGLFRKYAVIAQLCITGFSAITIWSALIDPFALYLPVDKVAGVQHLFYPTVIGLCAALVLIMFRHQDRLAFDRVFVEHDLESVTPEPSAA